MDLNDQEQRIIKAYRAGRSIISNCDFDFITRFSNEDRYAHIFAAPRSYNKRLMRERNELRSALHDVSEKISRGLTDAALDTIRDVLSDDRLTALPPETPMDRDAIEVAPLVWEESLRGRWIGTPRTPLGSLAFWVLQDGSGFKRMVKSEWQRHANLADAKAAAQSDYARLIQSNLRALSDTEGAG